MTPTRIYRFSIWLPVIVPAILIAGLTALQQAGVPRPTGVLSIVLQAVGFSLLYGGLPYILLAVWASRWIENRSERDIRRKMFVAPLLMVAVFCVACAAMGLGTSRMSVWLGVAGLGAAVTIPLGYFYVGLAMLLRRWLGPAAIDHATPAENH